jgi:hypothetical protein
MNFPLRLLARWKSLHPVGNDALLLRSGVRSQNNQAGFDALLSSSRSILRFAGLAAPGMSKGCNDWNL